MDNEIKWREKIEWQNIWWEKPSDIRIKRIALLGDSVTRKFRSKLNELLEGKYVVDICASSSQITDTLLWEEYKFFLDHCEWSYSKIMLHAGGQHGHSRQCCSDKEYLRLFKDSYKKLVSGLFSYCKDILIVSFTPCVDKSDLAKWDDERNKEIDKRNQIIREVAEEFDIPYIDIWTTLINAKYEFDDPIHMKTDGNNFIAEFIQTFVI